MQLEGRPIEWETQGLWPDALPATYAGSELDDDQAVLRAQAAATTAIFKTVQRPITWPRVRLADIQIAGQADSVYSGVARFYLEPAGHKRCILQLPASCALVQAAVGDVPAMLYRQAETNRWEMMLGPDRLPQTIRVVYTGKVIDGASPGNMPVVAAPVLLGITAERPKDIPVDHTLWTYFPLGEAVTARAGTAADSVGLLSQDLTRWQTGLSMMDLPTGVLADTSPDELKRWYVEWTREQAAVRRRITNAAGEFGPANQRAADLKRKWESIRGAWARRLGAAGAPEPLGDDAAAAHKPADIFATIVATPRATTHISQTRRTTQLPVVGPHVRWGDVLSRMLAVLCLLLAAGAIYFLNVRRPIHDLLLSYPRLVGVLVGLAWWLWLTPSVIGWILVAASLIPSVRRFPVVSSEPDTTRTGVFPLLNKSRR